MIRNLREGYLSNSLSLIYSASLGGSTRACASSPRKRIASGEKPPQTSLMSRVEDPLVEPPVIPYAA